MRESPPIPALDEVFAAPDAAKLPLDFVSVGVLAASSGAVLVTHDRHFDAIAEAADIDATVDWAIDL